MTDRTLIFAVVAAVGLAVILLVVVLLPDLDDTVEVPTAQTADPPPPAPTAATTVAVVAPPPVVVDDPPHPARSAPTAISSTAYCETGLMADGQPAHDGAVSSKVLPRGSSWRVLDGPLAGRTFTVEDTGALALFDVAMPGRCGDAVAYGRHQIFIEAAAR